LDQTIHSKPATYGLLLVNSSFPLNKI